MSLLELFIDVDNFCKDFELRQAKQLAENN